MAWNKGVNFGIFASDSMIHKYILAVFALVVAVGLTVWAYRRGTILFAIGAGLASGGALGNAYDRIVYGAVADFINVSCCGIVNPYAFNIADAAIFGGLGIVLLWGWEKDDSRN